MNNDVYVECPLLLPQDREKRSYDGFITVKEQTFRFSIQQGNLLENSRIDCSWWLWNILHGYEDIIKHRLAQSDNIASFLIEFKNFVEKLLACKEKSSFSLPLNVYSLLTSELEGIGWDKVVHVNELFNVIKIKASDAMQRQHVITFHLPEEYPKTLPKCSVDLPEVPDFNTSTVHNENILQQLYSKFSERLECYQEFWDTLDEIDQNCWVIEPEQPCRADVSRRLALGNNTSVNIKINAQHPKMLPECHFMGANRVVMNLRDVMNKNLHKWNLECSVLQNLQVLLETEFPTQQTTSKEDFNLECGICYAYKLDNSIPDKACDDQRCGQPFHSSCLYEWLRALSSSRQSFNVIFGECPYCSKSIMVKVQ